MNKNQYGGTFIVLEGIDGSGLSTQCQLLKQKLEQESSKKVMLTKEPTDGPIGSLIRQVLTNRIADLDPHSLALLFASDRIDHLKHKIIPVLEQGSIVICDRYVWSSLAYQGLEMDDSWLSSINNYILEPDITVFVRVSPQISMQRINQNRFHTELFEKERTLRRVMSNFDKIFKEWNSKGKHVITINGENDINQVSDQIFDYVKKTI